MADKSKKLELSKLIQNLRTELVKAQQEGKNDELSFLVEDVELELDIATEEGIEGGIAAKFYVLTSHYKANKKDAVTQKIRLKLKPVKSAKNPETGDEVLKPFQVSKKKKTKK